VVRHPHRRRARLLRLTAEHFSAERAERLGFVNVVTEPGAALAGALTLAERICANAPIAVRESLAIDNREINGDESTSWERSHAAHARLLATDDVKEGVGAFFERRAPQWTGK
jgi:enoyl-CoA hydratase/carnithine racemase